MATDQAVNTSPPSEPRTVAIAALIRPGASGANHLTRGSGAYGCGWRASVSEAARRQPGCSPVAGIGIEISIRGRDQRGELFVLGETKAHEALIRGVLEQAADEVGHARHELTHGRVDPQAEAELAERLVHGLCHAPEQLDLVAVVRVSPPHGPRRSRRRAIGGCASRTPPAHDRGGSERGRTHLSKFASVSAFFLIDRHWPRGRLRRRRSRCPSRRPSRAGCPRAPRGGRAQLHKEMRSS